MEQSVQQNYKKVLLIAGIGGMLEFYDFIIYALLVNYLAQLFFPIQNHITSLLVTFATFSVGYLARPIGGIVFGHFGDKYGRKKTFTLSIFMMAGATFSLGLIPSYSSIGIAAPIIVLSLRIIQGFSVGGQIPGAITYLSEAVPHRPGFACGLIFSFLINGVTLGAIVNSIVTSTLSPDAILHWGWRLPFFFGGIIGGVSYFLRKSFYETLDVKKVLEENIKFPIIQVLQANWRAVICGSLITAFGACYFSSFYLFAPAYLIKLLHYPPSQVNWTITFSLFIGAGLCIIFGWLSDRGIKKQLIILGTIIVGVSAYPIFDSFVTHEFNLISIFMVSSLICGLLWGVIPIILANLFETKIRYSGVGLTYNIGFALFGGLTPVIAMALIGATHQLQSPAYYLIVAAVLALGSIFIFPMKRE